MKFKSLKFFYNFNMKYKSLNIFIFPQNKNSGLLYKRNLELFIFCQNRNFGPHYKKSKNFFSFSKQKL